MTTPTTEPGTAVAATQKQDFLGALPPALRAAYELRQADALMRSEVAKQSWGEKLDNKQRYAISAFCQRHNLDPTMIDLLGGKLYRNANFWLDRLAKMFAAGKVEYAYPDYITVDPRLEKIAADKSDPERAELARKEKNRREDERVRWQVPDEALAACVFRVKLVGIQEVAGCKPVLASGNDPVGKGNPVTTAETRSARRALRKLVEVVPEIQQSWEVMEQDWKSLSATVTVGDVGDDESQPVRLGLPGGAVIKGAGPRLTPLASHGDGYDESPPADRMDPIPEQRSDAAPREPGEEDAQADLLEDQRVAEEDARREKAGKKGK